LLFDGRFLSLVAYFVYCDKEMVDEYKPKAVKFIEAIKALLDK
jgi:hypothetical protein